VFLKTGDKFKLIPGLIWMSHKFNFIVLCGIVVWYILCSFSTAVFGFSCVLSEFCDVLWRKKLRQKSHKGGWWEANFKMLINGEVKLKQDIPRTLKTLHDRWFVLLMLWHLLSYACYAVTYFIVWLNWVFILCDNYSYFRLLLNCICGYIIFIG